MRRILSATALALAALLVPACNSNNDDPSVTNVISGAIPPSSGTILALTTTNILLNVSATSPTSILNAVVVVGLVGGDPLLGIDYRPATGQLYGISSGNRLYLINPATGVAVQVGTTNTSFTLSGTDFGFDFNPTVDRIRVVSDADQNIRLNPGTGAIAATDTTLAYSATDVNVGANPNISGIAYTNNFAGATTTVLYGIDRDLDILVLQNPPNGGTLNTVGSLGVNPIADAAFDIAPSGIAYAGLVDPGNLTQLYTINLTTGAATLVGVLGSGSAIRGLTVVP